MAPCPRTATREPDVLQVAPFIVIGDMLEPLVEAVLPTYAEEWYLSRQFLTAMLGIIVRNGPSPAATPPHSHDTGRGRGNAV